MKRKKNNSRIDKPLRKLTKIKHEDGDLIPIGGEILFKPHHRVKNLGEKLAEWNKNSTDDPLLPNDYCIVEQIKTYNRHGQLLDHFVPWEEGTLVEDTSHLEDYYAVRAEFKVNKSEEFIPCNHFYKKANYGEIKLPMDESERVLHNLGDLEEYLVFEDTPEEYLDDIIAPIDIVEIALINDAPKAHLDQMIAYTKWNMEYLDVKKGDEAYEWHINLISVYSYFHKTMKLTLVQEAHNAIRKKQVPPQIAKTWLEEYPLPPPMDKLLEQYYPELLPDD